MQTMLTIAAHPDIKIARFGDERTVSIVGREVIVREGKADVFTFARLKRDALKSFQFFHWPNSGANGIAQIKLHHLCSRDSAAISDLNVHRQILGFIDCIGR